MITYYIVRAIVTAFIRLFFPYKTVGKENILDEPCVIVSNHLTNADAFIIGMHYKGKIYVLTKKESFSSKPVSWFLRTLGGFPIDRDNPDPSTILRCLKMLKEGKKLLVFPEGTRNRTEEPLLPLKSGAALFAIKSKVKVQTIYIYGRSRFLRRNYIKIGKPFELDNFYNTKLNSTLLSEADEVIRKKLLETREIPITRKKGKS